MITYYEYRYSLYKIDESVSPVVIETIYNTAGFCQIQKISDQSIVDSLLFAKDRDQWIPSNSETYDAEKSAILATIQS